MFKLRNPLITALLVFAAAAPALADEAACAAIIKAGNAKFSAPAFHDKMFENATSKTPHGEFIKIGDQAWMKADNEWIPVPPAMLKKMQNIDPQGLGMHNCKSLGYIGIRPANIYGWDLKVDGKVYSGSKLTVAADGLPTKTETGDGAYIVTTYNGVTAPGGAQ
jgi:hypothetical protein